MSDYVKMAKTAWKIISKWRAKRKAKKLEKQLAKAERVKAKAEREFQKRSTHVQKLKDIQKTANEPLNDELKDMEIIGI